ncbi:hypothetical protein KHM19_03770 [Leptospira borgpetersenii]|nr:hypothetical protein KHM09_05920 [Leptospira borgpetersenii]GIM21194.1 hypothetical protein KHM19_03770 [Leptospira borgpetersenii]GIM24452.1 hypothetical protein KHM25_03770 [Leptospira borgpetersenii]
MRRLRKNLGESPDFKITGEKGLFPILRFKSCIEVKTILLCFKERKEKKEFQGEIPEKRELRYFL